MKNPNRLAIILALLFSAALAIVLYIRDYPQTAMPSESTSPTSHALMSSRQSAHNSATLDPDPFDFANIQIDTSDWQTYINSGDAYSFKFPSNWRVDTIINPEFPRYQNVLAVHPATTTIGGEAPLEVGITCCIPPDSFWGRKASDTQMLEINGNKVIVTNSGTPNIGAMSNGDLVDIYLKAHNKIFSFNINQPDGYMPQALEVSAGIVKTFDVIK